MTRIFLDANAILDLLLDRNPFADAVQKLFEINSTNQIQLFCSSLTVNNIHYILSKEKKKGTLEASAKEIIRSLIDSVEVLGVTKSDIEKSLEMVGSDFEDNTQISVAEVNKMDFIVTRDKKGFKYSSIKPVEAGYLIDLLGMI